MEEGRRGEEELAAEDGMQEVEPGLDQLQPPYLEEILGGLKRRKLQLLCKRHNVRCSGKNAELIERLLQMSLPAVDQNDPTATNDDAHGEQIQLDEQENNPTPAAEHDESSSTGEQGDKPSLADEPDKPALVDAVASRKALSPTKEAPPAIKSAPTVRTGLRMPSQPGGRTSAAPRPPTIPMSSIKAAAPTAAGRKKFDLKESLKRPLGYVPHRGPLKPFSAQPPNP